MYPEMGIAFLVARERVTGADMQFQARDAFGLLGAPAVCEGFVPARLQMLAAGGAGMLLTPATTADEIRARLGRGHVDEGPEWLGLLYPRPCWELEFEFDADRALSSLCITYHDGDTA
ncbi:MAG TPA: hypothetical protein VF006_20515 [Longimicrobium sp.]